VKSDVCHVLGLVREEITMKSLARWIVVACWLALSALAGCGATQLSPSNRHLLETLQTAVSAKNTAWLDAVEKEVKETRKNGEISDAEFSALDSIIRQAKGGKWDTAQSAVFALSDGQRPTPEDLERLRERKPAHRTK
jgi:hypothetical protein